MVRKKSFEIKKVHKFRDGRLHVYKVSTSRNWMCRFYADGKYKVKSTLETNLSTAKISCGGEVGGPGTRDIVKKLESFTK